MTRMVFVVDTGGARFDHRLHQLEGVKHTSESGFGIRDNRRIPVVLRFALKPMKLIGPRQGIVQPAHECGQAVRRIEALVWVGLRRQIGIGCHLPAAAVDCLQATCNHLNGLRSRQRPKRVHVPLLVKQLPEAFSTVARQCLLDLDQGAQTNHFLWSVIAPDATPAGVGGPSFTQFSGLPGASFIIMCVRMCVRAPRSTDDRPLPPNSQAVRRPPAAQKTMLRFLRANSCAVRRYCGP